MTPDQIAFANELIHNGCFPSDVARRVSRRFNVAVTKEKVAALMDRGTLTDNRKVSDDDIRRMLADNVPLKEITRTLRVGFPRIYRVRDGREAANKSGKKTVKVHKSRRRKSDCIVPRDDPIEAIGVSFIEMSDNACRYPVARDPADNQFRYCGMTQMVRGRDRFGRVVRSSYCVDHHGVCHVPATVRSDAA